MQILLRIICGIAVCLGLVALAQDASPTASPAPTSSPAAGPVVSINSTPAPLPTPAADLIPNPANAPSADQAGPPQLPDISVLGRAFDNTSLGKEADSSRAHMEWRQLKNRVQSDPDIVAARRYAEEARTDLEKRHRLKAYYQLLFARMRSLASSPAVADFLATQRDGHLTLLEQPRVRPTPFISPTPTPSPSATPDISATPFIPLPVPQATFTPLQLPQAEKLSPTPAP